MEFSAAILLGLLGSLHCVGMCGPIALVVPIRTRSKGKRLFAALLYNFGRVLSYALLGLLFGAMGWSVSIAGPQRYLTIGMGVVLILYVIFTYIFKSKFTLISDDLLPIKWIRSKLAALMQNGSLKNVLFIGFLNGFLPCGLVYMAIAGAIASGSMMGGALFMIAFGLGTIPAMYLLMVLGKYMDLQWRNRIRKAIPVMLFVLGALFVMRGLNLGIPYLSPKISYEMSTVSGCH